MKKCKQSVKTGRVHSLESFSAQDGPGIRYVVFLQGCLGRCLYCQNPDTWDLKGGQNLSAKNVFDKIAKILPYMNASGGGITVSGGEPLLQPDFLIELFKLCRKKSIHTCIDTSCFYSISRNKQRPTSGGLLAPLMRGCAAHPSSPLSIDRLVDLTDLFLVDIKAVDRQLHKKITGGRDIDEALFFIDMLEKKKKPYWLRYVLVPGLNDKKEHLKALKKFVAGLKHCEKFEFLPYHTLGAHKWKLLGLKYPLSKLK